MQGNSSSDNRNFIKKLFVGDVPLVTTYWVFYVLIGGFGYRLLNLMIQKHYTTFALSPSGVWVVNGVYWFSIVYFLFSAIAVWRSASKYQGRAIWSGIAKALMIIGFLVTSWNVYTNNFAEDSIITQTRNEIKMMQAGLPKMVDEETRLDNMRFVEKTIFYSYTLPSYSIEDMDVDYFKSTMTSSLKDLNCTTDQVRSLLEAKITLNHTYRDKGGAPICQIKVTEADCVFAQKPTREDLPLETVGSGSAVKPSQIFDNYNEAVVLVQTYDEKGNLVGFGSGFNIHEEGVVVTNLHVIFSGASYIEIKFPKHGTYDEVQILGFSDTESDLALLGFEGKGLPTVNFREPAPVTTGDKIYTIGSPEGFVNTLSEGMVSGVRDIEGASFLQITAPISEGSSGGPVFNEKGEVVGVTTMMSKAGQNLNFAVDINEVSNVEIFDEQVTLKNIVDYIKVAKKIE